MKIFVALGTRPEAIKFAPIILELNRMSHLVASVVCVTAQHRELADEVLELFGIQPNYDLDVMTPGQSPNQVAAAVLRKLDPVLERESPDWVLVQGDTTSAASIALCAFYLGYRVAHVEAGLRTGVKRRPFPEEVNRRVVTQIADLHFAPTQIACSNLVREGVLRGSILVTGNTIVDALTLLATESEHGCSYPHVFPDTDKRLIVFTAHRRENIGANLIGICSALRTIATRWSHDVQIVVPVHPNPRVGAVVRQNLASAPNVLLTEPLPYPRFLALLKKAWLVVTDSGGIQEEAPSLGIPTLVLRSETERPEGVSNGIAKVIGTEPTHIEQSIERLLEDEHAYSVMQPASNPYGDGRASRRIVDALLGRPVEELN